MCAAEERASGLVGEFDVEAIHCLTAEAVVVLGSWGVFFFRFWRMGMCWSLGGAKGEMGYRGYGRSRC